MSSSFLQVVAPVPAPRVDAEPADVSPLVLEDRDITIEATAEENSVMVNFHTEGVITDLTMEFSIEAAREYRDWLNTVLTAHDARV